MQKLPHLAVAAAVVALNVVARAGDSQTTAAWARLQQRSAATLAALARETTELTAIGSETTDLSFAEFLLPTGDAGLEFSPRLKSLAGKRVRLTGYMVRQPGPQRGGFVLAPEAVTIETGGTCAAAEIPAHAVHVRSANPDTPVAYRPGRVNVTGVLEIGPLQDGNGRVTILRLRTDALERGANLAAKPSAVGEAP